MKAAKIILFVVLAVALLAGTFFIGLKSGADLVRNGLVANYPTIKNVVQGTQVEIDGQTQVTITKAENPELIKALGVEEEGDTVQLSLPYYGRYGVSIGGAFRALKNEDGEVEVWTPAIALRYCELKFDALMVNGKPVSVVDAAAKKQLYALFIPLLSKNKENVKAARLATTKALMFYFIPYQLKLNVYIDSQLQDLPLVPGVNQSVDEAIKQAIGK